MAVWNASNVWLCSSSVLCESCIFWGSNIFSDKTISGLELHFGWSKKLIDNFWNHVTINLTTWSRQIGPKCSIERVQIRLYYCVIVLPRIHWKLSLKLMRKEKWAIVKAYLYIFYFKSIWAQFVCFIFFLLHEAKYAVFLIASGIFWWF